MSSKRGKRRVPKCSIEPCTDSSQELYSCCACKSYFHYKCGSLDEDLIKLLKGNNSQGLSWYFRCEACVNNGVPDPLIVDSFLLNISDSISNKIDEYKNIFSNSFLLDADISIHNKIEDFKSSIKNAGMLHVDTPVADSSVQTDIVLTSSVQNTFMA